jgi:hypothetical protein
MGAVRDRPNDSLGGQTSGLILRSANAGKSSNFRGAGRSYPPPEEFKTAAHGTSEAAVSEVLKTSGSIENLTEKQPTGQSMLPRLEARYE